jgi:hypothetical protein
MEILLNTSFTDPGATASDPEDGALTVTSDCTNVNPTTAGEYACTYTATDREGHTAVVSRTVIVKDRNAPKVTCDQKSGSPSQHLRAGRAVPGGPFNLRALFKSDKVDIGASFDTWSKVVLHEGEPGTWYSQVPADCGSSSARELYCGTEFLARHADLRRVDEDLVKYTAKGSGQILGWRPMNSSDKVTLQETAPGRFVEVSHCP